MTITYTKEQILDFISETLENHNYFIYHTLYCTVDELSAFMHYHGFTLAKVPNQHNVIAYGYVDQSTGKAYNDELGETTLTELLPPDSHCEFKTLNRKAIVKLVREILYEYNSYVDSRFMDNYKELQKIMDPYGYNIVIITKPNEDDEEEEIEEFGYLDINTQKAYDVNGS